MSAITASYDDKLINQYNEKSYQDKVEFYDEQPPQGAFDIFQGWRPREYQKALLRFLDQRDPENPKQFRRNLKAISTQHRRGGKSTRTMRGILAPRMLQQPGLYHMVFPTLNQGRKVIWDGIAYDEQGTMYPIIESIPKQLWKRKDNHLMTLTLVNGSMLQIVGAVGVDGTCDHLRGVNTTFVNFDEAPEMDDSVYRTIYRPILDENGGGCLFTGTPKGENWYYDMDLAIQEKQRQGSLSHFRELLSIEDTLRNDGRPVISKEMIDEYLAEGEDWDLIQQEYYCSFKASDQASFYARQMQKMEADGRITFVKYDPSLPVMTYWDIGLNDETAIWLVQHVDQYRHNVIGFVQNRGVTLAEFFPILHSFNVNYGAHFLPWDAGQKDDVTGLTKIQRLEEMKLTNTPIVKVERFKSKQEGIDLVRTLLLKLWIDKGACREGIEALKQYKKKKNATTGNYTNEPVHNKASHGADAMRTFATALAKGMIADYTGTMIEPLSEEDLFADFEGLKDF